MAGGLVQVRYGIAGELPVLLLQSAIAREALNGTEGCETEYLIIAWKEED